MTTIEPTIEFQNDAWAKQKDYIKANAKSAKHTLVPGMLKGQTILICGAGPSLAVDFDETFQRVQPSQVWGCNSALMWLWNSQRPVTHGVAVAGEDGLLEDWKPFPPVDYLLSSGVSPVIVNLLNKKHRKVWYFHNLLGLFPKGDDEVAWYARLFKPALVVQRGGLNVTNRAIALAFGMDAEKVVVVGADCCLKLSDDPMPIPTPEMSDHDANELHWEWAARQTMYVDGRSPVEAYGRTILPEGVICGRRFVTRPDMTFSAQSLVDFQRQYGPKLELVGDTLPNWLLRFPDSQWKPFMPIQGDDGIVRNLGRQLQNAAP